MRQKICYIAAAETSKQQIVGNCVTLLWLVGPGFLDYLGLGYITLALDFHPLLLSKSNCNQSSYKPSFQHNQYKLHIALNGRSLLHGHR
jgi:hypothetical protein